MKLKYLTKYILSMISNGCVSLALINIALKDNRHKTIEDKASRIIIQSPKEASIPKSKEAVNDEGTRVIVPSTYGKPSSPVQPLPVPDSTTTIVITPLS